MGKKYGEATAQEFAAMISADRAAVQACIASQDDPDSFHACVKKAFKAAEKAATQDILKSIAFDVVDLAKSLKKCAHGQATEECVNRKVRDALSCFLTGRRRQAEAFPGQVIPPPSPILASPMGFVGTQDQLALNVAPAPASQPGPDCAFLPYCENCS